MSDCFTPLGEKDDEQPDLDEVPDGVEKTSASVLASPSLLAKFRLSGIYRKLIKKRNGEQNVISSLEQEPSNLAERAESAIDLLLAGGSTKDVIATLSEAPEPNGIEDFAFSVIAFLIDKGLDGNLVEVEAKGKALIIHFDDRIQEKKREVHSALKEMGDAKLIGTPDDDPELGTFIYQLTTSIAIPEPPDALKDIDKDQEDGAPQEAVQEDSIAAVINDLKRLLSGDPSLDDYDAKKKKRKKKRDESLNEGNYQPTTGDLILNTTTKRPFKVLSVVGNDNVKVKGYLPNDEEQIVSRVEIERALTSGSMKKLNEALITCPNCSDKDSDVRLKKSEASFVCSRCGFVADVAPHLSMQP